MPYKSKTLLVGVGAVTGSVVVDKMLRKFRIMNKKIDPFSNLVLYQVKWANINKIIVKITAARPVAWPSITIAIIEDQHNPSSGLFEILI